MNENDGKPGSASLLSLSEVAARIKRWRESRRRGEHVPPDIWVQALAQTREHGPQRVADALGLDLERLTRRMERDGGPTVCVECSKHVPAVRPSVFLVEARFGRVRRSTITTCLRVANIAPSDCE